MKAKKLLSLLAISMMMVVGCGPKGNGGEDPVDPPAPTCEHTYRFVSDGEAGHHEECSKCHDAKDIVPHTFDEGVAGTGVILYTCTACGYTKTETVEIYAAAGVYKFDNLENGDITERTKLAEGVYLNASSSYKFTVDGNAKAYTPVGGEEVTSTKRLKSNGASQNGGDRTIEINMEKAGRIIAYSMTSSSSGLNRQVALWNDATLVTTEGKLDAYQISPDYQVGNAVEAKEFHVVEKGKYYVGATSNASNFYAVQVIYDTCNHNFTKTDGAAATCSSRGSTVYACSLCNLSVTVNDKARLAHTWDDEHYVHADGKHWHECSVCHAVHGEKEACTPDPAKHKDADEPTADNPKTYQEDTCSVCNGTWQHDPREYVAPDQQEFTIADASKWTDETKKTEHVLSENCKFIFETANKLATGTTTDAAVKAFKIDPAKEADGTTKIVPNQTAWTDRYFHITGVKAGDVIKIKANVSGNNRGIKFGFTEEDKVVVPKVTTNADDINFIEHTVTAAEAENGVNFSAFTTDTLFVLSVVWVKNS